MKIKINVISIIIFYKLLWIDIKINKIIQKAEMEKKNNLKTAFSKLRNNNIKKTQKKSKKL